MSATPRTPPSKPASCPTATVIEEAIAEINTYRQYGAGNGGHHEFPEREVRPEATVVQVTKRRCRPDHLLASMPPSRPARPARRAAALPWSRMRVSSPTHGQCHRRNSAI